MNAPRINARKRPARGSMLIEVAAGFGLLVVVSLLLLKAALTVTTVQKWTVIQGLSDSFMSREVALGKRYPFDGADGFLAVGSPWPVYPAVATTTVEIGRLPGPGAGRPITGNLRRTRVPVTQTLNPTGTEAWQLQSFLTYSTGGRDYVKSRTVLRAR